MSVMSKTKCGLKALLFIKSDIAMNLQPQYLPERIEETIEGYLECMKTRDKLEECLLEAMGCIEQVYYHYNPEGRDDKDLLDLLKTMTNLKMELRWMQNNELKGKDDEK